MTEHEEDITVPLVIYIGDERRIVANAVVTGEEVRCFVHESRRGDFLGDIMDWIRREEVNGLSVTINPPPATPLVIDGKVKWVTDYRKGPTDNG